MLATVCFPLDGSSRGLRPAPSAAAAAVGGITDAFCAAVRELAVFFVIFDGAPHECVKMVVGGATRQENAHVTPVPPIAPPPRDPAIVTGQLRILDVMVVEDQPLFREMLAVLLADQNGLRVSAVASSAQSARNTDVRTLDVALIDLRLPDGDSIRLGRELRLRRPGLGILVLSASDSISTLLEVPGSEAAGWGFLSKNSSLSASALVYAIRAVAAGAPCSIPRSALNARSAATARSPGSAVASAKWSPSSPRA